MHYQQFNISAVMTYIYIYRYVFAISLQDIGDYGYPRPPFLISVGME